MFGSGAFTQLEAERQFNIEVADDADAFLTLDQAGGEGGTEYPPWDEDHGIDWTDTDMIEHDDGAISVTMDDSIGTGEGVNVDSLATLGRLEDIQEPGGGIEDAAFVIYNGHDSTLEIDVETDPTTGNEFQMVYENDPADGNSDDVTADTLVLDSEDAVGVVLWMDTDDFDGLDTVTFEADAVDM